MVVTDYLHHHLAPLWERARFAWIDTGSGDLTRTHIGPDGDLDEGALATLLNVVTGIDDLAWAVLPREDLALYTDPGRATLQVSMLEFDAQGLVDRPGRWNPGTIQIPGVDDNRGRGTAAEGSRPAARGDKGKHLWAYVPQPSSSSSPSPPPPKDPVGGQKQLEELRLAPVPGPSAPEDPEPRAPAGPEQQAPTKPAQSPPRKERVAAGEVVAMRAVPERQLSGTLSASTERARRGPSPQPPSGQALERLSEVLGSAREVIGRLEVAVTAERAKLDKERAALVDERGWLEEAQKLLETHITSARASYEKSMREVAEEWEALEETRNETVAAQEKANCMERLVTERDQASRRRAAKLLARERKLMSREEAASRREEAMRSALVDLACQNDELERGHAEVLRREEQVAIRKTDVKIMAVALDAREEQIGLREVDAASASSALTAREELVAKREADLAAREQAIEARAEQLQ
ncbi:uncharacterized protein LOC133886312 [Phragmites australis]|uniref:uncharacterized protein LOC133886312 n=1 Tax=Phragmites australis TaxID=29695 RepID=UPI002D78D1CF|nr:uncharacterized protein LOC133886312 [Phragmites australis]